MEQITDGGVHTAEGFLVAGARCGIKTAEGAPDVALIVSETPACGAGTFTRNRFAAPSVAWNRAILPGQDLRAVLVNAGNANAFTGARGQRDVRTSAGLVAELLACRPEQVCVASTGIIGQPLPMDRLTEGIRLAHAALGREARRGHDAARAIMTTDTRPKECAVRHAADGVPFRIGGMAKGSGMIAPNMATMLVFVTTDAAVPPDVLAPCLREVVEVTFNRITVDGDSSTNDSVIVLANGASGARLAADGAGIEPFREALHAVLSDLCRRIVADGEGATRPFRVEVTGAASRQDADRIARAIAESQLVKCAVAGGDPNWGRIVCAAGYCGAEARAESTTVRIGDVCVVSNGTPTGADATAAMQQPEVTMSIDMGLGAGESFMLSCDLTAEYVHINADYHT